MQIKAASGYRDMKMTQAPIPPVGDYDKWLAGRNWRTFSSPHKAWVTGAKLRRAVIMRKQGETWKDCAAATGLATTTLRGYIEFMPMHMQP